MTISSRIRSLFQGKASASRQVIVSNVGRAISTPDRYENLAKEAFSANAVAYTAISLIARNAAGVRWALYKRATGKGGKKRQEIEEHPLLALLKRPNPTQGQSAFFEALTAYRCLAGNYFVEAVKAGDAGPPRELWNLRPDRMSILPGVDGYPAGYLFKAAGKEVRWDVDIVSGKMPILHGKTFNPLNDWYGMSPVMAARYAIDLHNESSNFNLATFQNQGRPSGILTTDGQLANDQRGRLKEMLSNRVEGSANAGRLMVMEGGLKWQSTALSPQDMEWLDGRSASAREIGLVFGVPAMLLNISGDNTYANYAEARQAFWMDTVIPALESLQDELNHWLLPQFGDGLELGFDQDKISALEPTRSATWMKVSAATFLTTNEKRDAVGYEPVLEGGDDILVGTGLVPLSYSVSDPTAGDDTSQNPNDSEEPADVADEIEGDDGATTDEEDAEAEKAAAIYPATKILNLTSDRARVSEWRTVVKLRGAYQRKLQNALSTAFAIQKREAIAVIKESGSLIEASAKLADVAPDNSPELASVLQAYYLKAGKAFGKRVLSSLKWTDGAPETKADEHEVELSFEKLLDAWAKTQSRDVSREVSRVTRKKLKDQADEAGKAGESLSDLEKRVTEVFNRFRTERAQTISRTELMAVSNAASVDAAKASGIPNLRKEWVAAEDERVRGALDGKSWGHAQVDGTIVGANDPFPVYDEDGTLHAMQQPGDSAGGPGQVINCRCTIAFVSKGDTG